MATYITPLFHFLGLPYSHMLSSDYVACMIILTLLEYRPLRSVMVSKNDGRVFRRT